MIDQVKRKKKKETKLRGSRKKMHNCPLIEYLTPLVNELGQDDSWYDDFIR